MASIPRYVVYVLARPSNKPFYVGKGTRRRMGAHETEARSGHKCHKCNVIRKIWKQGGKVRRYIVFTTDNEQEAFDYECKTIALYGRENLCNQTDGGEGASGHVMPEHVRKIVIQSNTGREFSQERRENIATGQTNGRTYVARSPDGTLYPGIKNMRIFERAHGISDQGLYMVVLGRATHGNGWTAWVEGEQPKALPKMYTIISPDGTQYSHVWNVAAFAKEHELDGHYLRAMLRGTWPHAHGWTGFRERLDS